MAGISADVRVGHPDIVLTETVRRDPTSTVRSVSEAGTDPSSGKFFYHVRSADFEAFDAGLRADRTIRAFERVTDTGDGAAIYSFEYTAAAKVLSPIISAANGVILDMENDGHAWLLTIWMPERTELDALWAYAERHDIEIELLRLHEYGGLETTDAGVTDRQRRALLLAFERGYFDEPRGVTLEEVAEELGISQPAAGGLLRRGTGRLIESSLLASGERPK